MRKAINDEYIISRAVLLSSRLISILFKYVISSLYSSMFILYHHGHFSMFRESRK